jgi:hypothetical protein
MTNFRVQIVFFQFAKIKFSFKRNFEKKTHETSHGEGKYANFSQGTFIDKYIYHNLSFTLIRKSDFALSLQVYRTNNKFYKMQKLIVKSWSEIGCVHKLSLIYNYFLNNKNIFCIF